MKSGFNSLEEACGSQRRGSGRGLGWKRSSGELDSGTPVASGRLRFGGRGSGPLPKWRLVVAALPEWCGEKAVPVKCKRT